MLDPKRAAAREEAAVGSVLPWLRMGVGVHARTLVHPKMPSPGEGDWPTFATVNVVVLAGSVAADPVQRRMPSGDEVTELRLRSGGG